MGLLRYDPYTNALLCITSEGIFVFDIAAWSWADVTPQGYRNDYAAAPTNGLLPRGCMGDFVEQRAGQTMRKIVWRPGMNHSWDLRLRRHKSGAHVQALPRDQARAAGLKHEERK